MSGAAALANSAKADVSAQLYNPSSSSKFSYTENARGELPEGEVPEKYIRYLLGMNYNYVHDPLVELNEARTERVRTLINGIQTFNLLGGLDYNGLISFGIDAPLNVVHMPNTAAQFGVGDIRLFAKWYLISNRTSKFGLSLMPEVKLPTGNASLFLGDGGTSVGAVFGAEYDFGKVALAGNIGYRHVFAGGAQFDIINFQNQVPMKLGLAIPVGLKWAINIEGTATLMTSPLDKFQLPAEAYLGARVKPTQDMSISLGAAIGSLNRIGSSDFRILAGLKFYPSWKKYAPKPIVEVPKPAPKVEKPRVEFTAKAIVINEEIRFEHNSDVLTPSGKSLLDEVAKVIKDNRASIAKIKIEGHTNEIGSHEYNMNLSNKRANSVRWYLVSRGIETSILDAMGFGKTRPKSAGLLVSKQVRLEMDRRVEFKVVAPVKAAKKPAPQEPQAQAGGATPRG
jgi:outer membrane protein OmpA-like peptidoglycan-associated protein